MLIKNIQMMFTYKITVYDDFGEKKLNAYYLIAENKISAISTLAKQMRLHKNICTCEQLTF